MKLESRLLHISFAAIGSLAVAAAQTPLAASASETAAARATLGLSPAIIEVRCNPGQGITQTLTITNNTASDVRFNLETDDVVVSDGKRSFSRAGEIPNSIASTSVAAPSFV